MSVSSVIHSLLSPQIFHIPQGCRRRWMWSPQALHIPCKGRNRSVPRDPVGERRGQNSNFTAVAVEYGEETQAVCFMQTQSSWPRCQETSGHRLGTWQSAIFPTLSRLRPVPTTMATPGCSRWVAVLLMEGWSLTCPPALAGCEDGEGRKILRDSYQTP